MPALRALRASRADARVALAAQPRIGRLLVELGVVDDAVDFESLHLDRLFARDIGSAGPAPLGAWLEPPTGRARPTAPARLVCWFGSGAPDFVARLRALAPDAIVAPPWERGRPVWEHLLATIGVSPAGAARFREPIAVPRPLVEAGGRALARAGWDGATPIVLVHPGAGGVAKRWPAEGFAAVLGRVASARRVALVVHEGPADREASVELAARLRAPFVRLRAAPLAELAGALARATAYLGNDSGVSHLAAAVGTPSVALFTRDKLDWRPWPSGAEPLVVETSALRAADVERVLAALQGRVR